jgi:thiol-disulfide isomerase/thioredoxin
VAAKTVLLDFMSDTCPPCREMAPVMRELAGQGYDVREVNLSYDHKSAAKYNVTLTPTFLVMVDGHEWARLTGKSTSAQLVEMIHKATALAESHSRAMVRGQSPGAITPVDLQSRSGKSMPNEGGATFAAGPAPGRMVDIRQTSAAVPLSPQAARLIAASVRLSIEDPGGLSTGTGAIVDAREGEALVLTCGHLFRESQGKGRIEISLFTVTPTGVKVRERAEGVLLHYDLERDLALVRFRTMSPPAVAPVAPLGAALQPGAAVTSVGCNHGDDPTAWSTRITAINRYQGHPNIEAGMAPVEGRSGGGLFNEQGQLIGVCFAADPSGNEGLYASLTSIQAQLDELQLSKIYQSPVGGQAPVAPQVAPTQLATAAADQNFAVRGQDPAASAVGAPVADWPIRSGGVVPAQSAASSSAPLAAPVANASATADLSPQEQAALDEITRRGTNAEVICIIRPLTADGPSDVIKLSKVSPAFVKALTTATSQGAAPGNPFDGALPTAAASRPPIR